jgi:hypothetical protein
VDISFHKIQEANNTWETLLVYSKVKDKHMTTTHQLETHLMYCYQPIPILLFLARPFKRKPSLKTLIQCNLEVTVQPTKEDNQAVQIECQLRHCLQTVRTILDSF